MPSNYSALTVTWFDNTDSYVTNADITNDVKGIPLFTDTGTGEVNQATIVLRSLAGKYIVSGSIIDKHDRFHIECTDLAGNNYDRYFEVLDIIPSQSKAEGTLLTLECLGTEYHTQHLNVARPFYFTNGQFVAKTIADMYNASIGSQQPSLVNANAAWNGDVGNALPDFTANLFEYGLSEDTPYNRWMDLLDKFGASVDAGGSLTFYELSFKAIDTNIIRFRLRPSGDNTPTVTIKNAKVTNPQTVGDQEAKISNPTGTNVLAWGSPDHGSLPVDFSEYDSHLIQFLFRPEWSSTVTYSADSKVQVTRSNGVTPHYKSLQNNNLNHTPPFSAGSSASDAWWQQIDQKDQFGDTVQYSPWTDDKAQLWINAMANPAGATKYAWDFNLVIWSETFFRTWVDAVASTDAHLAALIDNGAANEGYAYNFADVTTLPRGFRVLVNSGSPTGALANFANQVAEWTGTKWQKKYSFLASNNKVQVAVIHEAKIYEGDSFATTPTWTAKDAANYGNDCFHPVISVVEADGVDVVNGTPRSEITDATNYPHITDTTGQAFTKNINSALKFTYTWADIISSAITPSTGAWYKRGAWACFRLPFPVNDYNTITETVGQLYGGTSTSKEPATLDIQNMGFTHDGKTGFNQGDSSEDLGQINSIAFWCKLEVSGLDIDANHKMNVFMIDTNDNIVHSEFELEFSNHWQDIRIPIGSFRIYRGRRPAYGIENVITLVPPKELEVVNIFEWRNIRFIGIQYMPVYDQFGRYNPTSNILDDSAPSIIFNALAGGTLSLYIDAFRFVKPLLVTSGQNTTMNIEPNFLQRPGISVYHQLKNDVKAQVEIEKFQHKEYNLETSGDAIFNIPFGDSFLFENNEVVFVASPNANETTNKIQLTAKRIEYSLTKPTIGIGGLRRRMLGSKVFV